MAGQYDFVSERCFGNLAHAFVLNSRVLRVRRRLKRLYGTPLMAAEAALNPLLGRRLSCSVSCQWHKVA